MPSLAYSPDGRTLATGYENGAFELWDVATRTRRATLSGHTERVWCVAFAPDGHTVATTSHDGTIRLWEPAEHPDRVIFRGPRGPGIVASSIAFSRDGADVLAANRAGNVLKCNLATETAVEFKLLDQSSHWNGAWISPDATHLVAHRIFKGTPDRIPDETLSDLVVCDLSGRRQPVMLWESIRPFGPPVWSRDGTRFAQVDAASHDLRLWDTTGRSLGHLEGEFGTGSSSPAFLPGSTLVVASVGGGFPEGIRPFSYIAWDPISSRINRPPVASPQISGSTVVSPDGRTLAERMNRTVILRDVSGLTRRRELIGHQDYVTDLAFAPDGRTLATASHDHTVRLWSVASAQELLVLQGQTGPILAVAFSADGRALAACGNSSDGGIEVNVWRTDHGAPSAAASREANR